MPKQEPSGPKGPVVRRAVLLPGSTSEPDPDAPLERGGDPDEAQGTPPGEPAAPPAPPVPPASFEPGGSGGSAGPGGPAGSSARTGPETPRSTPFSKPEPEQEGEPGPNPVTASGPGGAAAAPDPSAPPLPSARTASGPTTSTPAASAPAAAASAASARPATASAGSGGDPGAGSGPGGVAAAAAAGAGAGEPPPEASTATATEDPPSGRPTKALRAAAAIAGALLIAVPLLALGAGDDDEKDEAEPASGVTVPRDDELPTPGSYKGESPSPHKSESEKKTKDTGSDVKPDATADATQPATKPKSEKKKKPAKAAAPDPSQTKNTLLRNVMTGMCADVPKFGKGKADGPVNQFHCKPGPADNQMWDLVVKHKKAGPGNANLFLIRNTKDGLCVDLPGFGGKEPRTGLFEYPCNGSFRDNQLWWLDDRGDGKFWIRNYASNQQCMDVRGKKFGAGGKDARLGIANCNPADDHEWRLG